MYIISSITFLGMPSQFLNSGKIGTFLFTDGHSGWWSLPLITLSFLYDFIKDSISHYNKTLLPCRHLYKPLLRRGVSKQVASVAVFATSAFFHEVCNLRLMPQTYWHIHSFWKFILHVQSNACFNKICLFFVCSIYLVFL